MAAILVLALDLMLTGVRSKRRRLLPTPVLLMRIWLTLPRGSWWIYLSGVQSCELTSVHFVEREKTVGLNSGYPADPSICVPVVMAALLLDRFGIKDIALLSHTTVLVFGPVRISPRGKRYVLLQNPLYLMVTFAQL